MTSSDDLRSPVPRRATEPPDANRPPRGGAELGALLAAERLLLDRLSAASLSADVTRDVTHRLDELNDLLLDHQVPEQDRVDGLRPDLPGRGHVALPAFVVDEADATSLRGRVTFTRVHLGGNWAVHGGVQPLLFDDILGRIVNQGVPFASRTAYLKVDYRRVTPLEVELVFEGNLDRVEGRKRFASGRLLDAEGNVLCDATALYVELLPGQP